MKERRICNASGGASAYTVRRTPEAPGFEGIYAVHGNPRGKRHTWYVHGHNGQVIRTTSTQRLPEYVAEAVRSEWARDQLRDLCPPGTTLYTVLHHVARSGMTRRIGVRVIEDGQPRYLDGLVHRAAPDFFRLSESGGIVMGGCGMDMGFHLVSSLSSILYPDGFRCLGEDGNCPSNDHANDWGEFNHKYDQKHAPEGSPWWLTDDGFHADDARSDEEREQQRAYREAKRAEWQSGDGKRYSRRRVHSSGDYALRRVWL